MHRREFIAGIAGSAAAWPLAVEAQQREIPVIGFLLLGSADSAIGPAAFRQGLRELGFVEGQNVLIEYRFANGQTEQLPAMAAELVQRRVSVLVAGARADVIAKNATATIPIVFVSGSDPVRLGIVASLNRPGGNATGMMTLAGELEQKRFGLLHELTPQVDTIWILIDQNRQDRESLEQIYESTARQVGLAVRFVRIADQRDFEASFAQLAREGTKALAATSSSYFNTYRAQLVSLSARYAIPTMYETREFVEAGGLMSYGPNIPEVWRKVGVYTGRVLKGEKPADLPVQRPTKFDFMINLKTAKALGLTIPSSVLAIADEVIE
jgi:putative tryptophan/tyrosine transport system substrate-binding protein